MLCLVRDPGQDTARYLDPNPHPQYPPPTPPAPTKVCSRCVSFHHFHHIQYTLRMLSYAHNSKIDFNRYLCLWIEGKEEEEEEKKITCQRRDEKEDKYKHLKTDRQGEKTEYPSDLL